MVGPLILTLDWKAMLLNWCHISESNRQERTDDTICQCVIQIICFSELLIGWIFLLSSLKLGNCTFSSLTFSAEVWPFANILNAQLILSVGQYALKIHSTQFDCSKPKVSSDLQTCHKMCSRVGIPLCRTNLESGKNTGSNLAKHGSDLAGGEQMSNSNDITYSNECGESADDRNRGGINKLALWGQSHHDSLMFTSSSASSVVTLSLPWHCYPSNPRAGEEKDVTEGQTRQRPLWTQLTGCIPSMLTVLSFGQLNDQKPVWLWKKKHRQNVIRIWIIAPIHLH